MNKLNVVVTDGLIATEMAPSFPELEEAAGLEPGALKECESGDDALHKLSTSPQLGDTLEINEADKIAGFEDGWEIEAIGSVDEFGLEEMDDGQEVVIGAVKRGKVSKTVRARVRRKSSRSKSYRQASQLRNALDIALNPAIDVTIAESTNNAAITLRPVEPGEYAGLRIRCNRGTEGFKIEKVDVNGKEQRILALQTVGTVAAGLTTDNGVRALPREGGDVLIPLPPANYSQSDNFTIYLSNDDTVNACSGVIQLIRSVQFPGNTDNLRT